MVLAHHDLGGTGPSLLLLHANGFHGHTLAPLAGHLRSHFHCIALDLNGHGTSPPLGADTTLAVQAAAVLAKIHELGLSGCYCFGHSAGGVLALLLAAAPTAAGRATFAALYCYEPVASGTPQPHTSGSSNILATLALRRRDRWPSMEAARATLGAKPPFSKFHPDAFDEYLKHGLRPSTRDGSTGSAKGGSGGSGSDGSGGSGSVELCCTRESESWVYLSLQTPACADWASVRCPVVIAVGGPGGYISMSEQGPALAATLPVSRLQRFPALGHLGPMEDPEAVALHVAQCFAEVAATGTLSQAQARL